MITYKEYDAINEICAWMEDEESIIVLKQRFLYSLTKDVRHIYNMLKLTGFSLSMLKGMYKKEVETMYGDLIKHEDLLTFLLEHEKNEVVIFGCGIDSYKMVTLLEFADISIYAFADNYKVGKFLNHSIIKVEEIPQNMSVVISSKLHRDEMLKQLNERGFKDEQIFYPDVNALYCPIKTSYFDEDIFKPQDEEIFIDGGAFRGETSKKFSLWAKSYKEIIAFEPDAFNVEVCRETLRSVENVTVLQAGLWENNEKLSFKRAGDEGASSEVNKNGLNEERDGLLEVDGVALDSIIKGKVSFLKLDIEGAELKALYGAKGIIQRDRPRMAICIYHKPEDIWEIPLYIKKLVPEYHMAVRHCMTYVYDTILYCWI